MALTSKFTTYTLYLKPSQLETPLLIIEFDPRRFRVPNDSLAFAAMMGCRMRKVASQMVFLLFLPRSPCNLL